MKIDKTINERFEDFIFDWEHRTYLLIGAYGSSKSYHAALKIIFKCIEEKRKVLVVREVYDTIKDSCFDLLFEILDDMGILYDGQAGYKVSYRLSPLQFIFPNGSRIIFKGMDKPSKLKSINDVSIIWVEEASELKYSGYKELTGRARHPYLPVHFILTTNPAPLENWVYKHFFVRQEDDGKRIIKLDDEELYDKKTIVKNGVYYHHSLPEDNAFIQNEYIKTLDEMKEYDPDLYRVARLGRFGVSGLRVLPQFIVAKKHANVMANVRKISEQYKFIGFDLGFEESFNAVVKMAIDHKKQWLYIYGEFYKNHMTDDETADELLEWDPDIKYKMMSMDDAEPKAIRYFRKQGFAVRKCKSKYAGSRLANTRKVKRFKKIICSPRCINTIRELQNLTYFTDRNGNTIYDKFNIDPHTFSAIWYGLDLYDVADVKEQKTNTIRGGEEYVL